jgi:hypothetical protein
MTEEKHKLIKKVDGFLEQLGDFYHNHNLEALLKILKRPKEEIVAGLFGAIAKGKSEAILMSGRIVQASLKGNAIEQMCIEVEALIDKGKIKEDYANSKHGFQSLYEILDLIDKDVPDEDKFNAMKALFYSVISADINEGERILNYQLFQIAKNLTSSQILVLKVCHDIRQKNEIPKDLNFLCDWNSMVAKHIGHGIGSLIERDEETLLQNKLLTSHNETRGTVNSVGIFKDNARLSGLGIKLCENLIKYNFKEMISKKD